MNSVLRLIALPFRAPLVLLLIGVSVYLGMHWTLTLPELSQRFSSPGHFILLVEYLHAVVVVVICTMPDLLLFRLSQLMAASRVVSLVVSLLLVTLAGLYLLHLNILANVLILAPAVLLARLDLVRIRVVPSSTTMVLVLNILVLSGLMAGRWLSTHGQALGASA
ncbi:hypothetical protein VB716_10130 [Synechococcus sp. CCY9201]|uniref:hypothetical protein n=1 Tax=unclassified Synechococcus TaxID=2626047 RepID=UPI002B2046D9|nr:MULTISPECIES: hypothetical protein [unclassified Synechococcus]MEA5422879.1 hypothetical protein [Synechococcus sp. CCY9202]MEA5474575.1 hypothetical protein [Synechococcus sp. CCY9201]